MTIRRRRVAVVQLYPVGWLQLDDVKRQLAIDNVDTDDDVLIQACIDAAEPEVCRARPDAWTEDPPSTPADYPDAYRGGVMLAARLVRRRNSPAGIESFGESITYVAAYDPDLDRFMRRGRYRLPGVG
ncbi:MAG: head-tail connector protein [Mycobacterium sp.]